MFHNSSSVSLVRFSCNFCFFCLLFFTSFSFYFFFCSIMRTFYLRRGVMLQLVTVPSSSVTSFSLLSRLLPLSLCSLIHTAHVSFFSAHFPLSMYELRL